MMPATISKKIASSARRSGDREGAGEDLGDGLTREGDAEVAVEDAAEVEEVLDDERLVEVVLLAELLEHCRAAAVLSPKSATIGSPGMAKTMK